MSLELENLIGDDSDVAFQAPRLAVPQNLGVRVGRRGLDVWLIVGNADPVRFAYADAMRKGLAIMREGVKARRDKRPAELKVGLGKAACDGATLIQIGKWLLAKGNEAKFLAGDRARLQV